MIYAAKQRDEGSINAAKQGYAAKQGLSAAKQGLRAANKG